MVFDLTQSVVTFDFKLVLSAVKSALRRNFNLVLRVCVKTPFGFASADVLCWFFQRGVFKLLKPAFTWKSDVQRCNEVV